MHGISYKLAKVTDIARKYYLKRKNLLSVIPKGFFSVFLKKNNY
jgi:hypothetical protein